MKILKIIKKIFSKHLITTIFLSLLAIFGLAFVVYSTSTTIGANIATTGNLEIGGNATTTGNQVVYGTLSVFSTTTLSGRVGIGTTTPTRKLEILDTVNPQLRLTYDGTNYTDIRNSSTGNLVITPAAALSGGNVVIGTDQNITASVTIDRTISGGDNVIVRGFRDQSTFQRDGTVSYARF